MKIAYLGPRGSFSLLAAQKYDPDAEYLPCTSIPLLMETVCEDAADCGIVPVENSLDGAIGITLDSIADLPLVITGEIILSIEQCLLVFPGTKETDIRRILSHFQPLGQCANYLKNHFPGIYTEQTSSTSEAAKKVAEARGALAAIGSELAAGEYGLEVLKRGIGDAASKTRFWVVTRDALRPARENADMISVMFATENRPGSLYRVLQILDVFNLNMTHIESRPSRKCFGEYRFFVDFIGNIADDYPKKALEILKLKTDEFKLLGNYRSAREGSFLLSVKS